MTRHAYRRRVNGAPRRASIRTRHKNSRWMHLASAEIGTRQAIQRCWARCTNAVTRCLFVAAYATVLRLLFAQRPMLCRALGRIITFVLAQLSAFLHNVSFFRQLDHLLYDIPDIEWNYKRQFRLRQHLRIGTIPDDMTAKKMTSFSISQIRRLYRCFGLGEYCQAHGDVDLRLFSGHFDPDTGAPKCYVFNPEELFLFMLTKVKTGKTDEQVTDDYFGGDYARWHLGYRWLILHLDERYRNIIGLQGMLRFLPDFPRFRDAIERYCQKDRVYFDNDGNMTIVPGIEELPYNICGLIDDSVDPSLVSHSGPAGDFVGAPRKRQYATAQESVYSGWKKVHGIKVMTVFFPNGISTIFGPVSCRRNDRGTLNLSGLDRFMRLIQQHLPPALRCMLFGDSIFHGMLKHITTYYRAIAPNVLIPAELKCNGTFRAMRIPIERNYCQTSCVQRICDTRRSNSLGKKHPYALEQLRVAHLLMNCYICLNGDQGSHVNTFGVLPPRLEDYLRL